LNHRVEPQIRLDDLILERGSGEKETCFLNGNFLSLSGNSVKSLPEIEKPSRPHSTKIVIIQDSGQGDRAIRGPISYYRFSGIEVLTREGERLVHMLKRLDLFFVQNRNHINDIDHDE